MLIRGKKISFSSFVLIGWIVIVLVGIAWAASSVSYTEYDTDLSENDDMKRWEIAWVASDEGGVSEVASDDPVRGWVEYAIVIPGSGVSPTDDYDITIEDDFGQDIFGGALGNMSDTTINQYAPQFQTSVYGQRFVESGVTVKVTNNSVSNATGEIILYIRGKQ